MHFLNRQDAGRLLAKALASYSGCDGVVYALPRGGVVLGYEVAKALGLPLDLVITRKIGHPNMPEYAIGAVTEKNGLICNEEERSQISPNWLAEAVEKQRQEAVRRRRVYLKDTPHISPAGKIAIIVDDGIATGLTIRAAVQSVRAEKPKELVVAVPVAPHNTVVQLQEEADTVVVLEDDWDYLGAVGAYYDDFRQVSDEAVIDFLNRSRHEAKNR
ncbi:MAG: phosphoribosyl transferase [Chlorobiales bacterium]|nr:phosphoribosyl transferase [Chlorobiales bacterium]